MLKLKHLDRALRHEQMLERTAWKAANEGQPSMSARVRHRAAKADARGRVSALCFKTPRAIDMKRASWVMTDEAVTCQKCKAMISLRVAVPAGVADESPSAPRPPSRS